jgi:hypothetical protein
MTCNRYRYASEGWDRRNKGDSTIRAEGSLPRVRIAALTCFSSEEYQRNAFAAGVDLFLIKPVPMKALKPILEMDPDIA